MKAFLSLLLLSWFFTLYLPWWSILIPGLLVGAWLCRDAMDGFRNGFFATSLGWIVQAGITSAQNDGILLHRVGEILSGSPSWLVVGMIGLAGGLLGGTAASLGVRIRESLKPAFNSKE